QEVLNRFHLDNTAAGMALTAGFLLLVLGWCWRCRDAGGERIFDFLCFVAVLWTYHQPYDFVVLLVPLTRRMLGEGSARERGIASLSFMILTLALASGILGMWNDPIFRCLRWLARFVLVGWFVGLAIQLRRERPASVAGAALRAAA